MAKLTSILQERFRKKEKPKVSELALKSALGELTPFSGLFGSAAAGEKERAEISALLTRYSFETDPDIDADLHSLLAITSEVKAINNQAALLHGERIKKAQEILKNYRDGAFTAWLKAAYGNRQTPYNFLQYFDFFSKVSKTLHPQVEMMPRQAVYTLASREGDFSKKEEIVRNYKGESKQEVLALIRETFPLNITDGRRENFVENTWKQLKRLEALITQTAAQLSPKERRLLLESLDKLKNQIINI